MKMTILALATVFAIACGMPDAPTPAVADRAGLSSNPSDIPGYNLLQEFEYVSTTALNGTAAPTTTWSCSDGGVGTYPDYARVTVWPTQNPNVVHLTRQSLQGSGDVVTCEGWFGPANMLPDDGARSIPWYDGSENRSANQLATGLPIHVSAYRYWLVLETDPDNVAHRSFCSRQYDPTPFYFTGEPGLIYNPAPKQFGTTANAWAFYTTTTLARNGSPSWPTDTVEMVESLTTWPHNLPPGRTCEAKVTALVSAPRGFHTRPAAGSIVAPQLP